MKLSERWKGGILAPEVAQKLELQDQKSKKDKIGRALFFTLPRLKKRLQEMHDNYYLDEEGKKFIKDLEDEEKVLEMIERMK